MNARIPEFIPCWKSSLMRSGIGRTMLLWSLLIALLPLLAVSLLNYWQISRALRQDLDQKLIAVSKLKAQQVEQFFQCALADAGLLAGNPAVQQYLMQPSFSGKGSTLPAGALEQQAKDLLQRTGYQDLLLLDSRGNIVYARREKGWIGRNILEENNSSQLARACQRALRNQIAALADFEKLPVYNDTAAGFTVHPVDHPDGRVLGYVALRLAIAQLNQIMHQDAGLGQDSEVGLIGSDLRLRNDSPLEEGSTALGKPINTLQPRLWYKEHVQGNMPAEMDEQTSAYTGRRGVPIVAVHRHLEVDGVKMGIFAVASQAEALGAIRKQRNICILLFFAAGALIALLAGRLVQGLVQPLRQLNHWTRQVAAGDLQHMAIAAPANELGQLRDSFSAMVDSFKAVSDTCQAVARGDFSHQIAPRSDRDVLAASVNQMIEKLRGVVSQARAIAGGDYATKITPLSEDDQLGLAIQTMVADLRRVREENRQRNWLKNGLMAVNDQLRGELAPAELAQRALTALATHLEARAAVFYLYDDQSRLLHLLASYAFSRRKNMALQLSEGEGLVGQSVLEKKTIVLTNVPADYYVNVNSGLGETAPHQIVITPLVYNGQVKGVVEMATLSELEDVQLEFLERAAENIAIALETARARQRMAELLEKTRQQAEELQVQQEELRQMNEELEEQTRILKESQSRLQDQQEELRQINEELEERTEILEKQRRILEQKNRELEEARQGLQQKARELELASRYKSEFLANMSHELRTPLNSVLILARLLSENKEGNLTSRQVEYARTIYAAGSDLLNLINDILDLSKIESGRLELNREAVHLPKLAADLERQFRYQAREKNLEFAVVVNPDVPSTISADRQRLEQIIKNLLSNAFKFTERGRVQLEFTLSDRPAGTSELPDRLLAIAVSDTGKGIAPSKQQLIFEAFQQEDGTISRRYGGTGLGLSISRELARLMGGEIHLVSQEGQGSTFTLYLPLEPAGQMEQSSTLSDSTAGLPQLPEKTVEQVAAVAGADPPVAVNQHPAHAQQPVETFADNGQRLVLIIEDDARFAGLLADLARQKGFQTARAESGENGLALARQLRPAAIILDIGLPGIDGWKVLEMLKKDHLTRHIPVHIISAHDHSLEALRQGAIGYLTKPVSPEDLERAFQKIQDLISKQVKKLLVVEDDPQQRRSILELIGNGDVVTTAVGSGGEAFRLLKENKYDCVVLDLGLQDMSGFTLLEKIKADPELRHIPVIVYTGKELTREEESILNALAESIIVKGARSPERLLYETTLFLHRVEANLPSVQRQALRVLHEQDQIFQGKKILLVDDDMRNVFALLSILEEKGLEIMVARNGREALQKLDEHPDTDLVLMDIMMPEMDGYQAMRAIRQQERFKDLPIIALTAKAMVGDREKSLAAGASDYLSKPVDPDKLISLLRVWLYR